MIYGRVVIVKIECEILIIYWMGYVSVLKVSEWVSLLLNDKKSFSIEKLLCLCKETEVPL